MMSAVCVLLAIAAEQRVTFIKSFPQSEPAYVAITVEENGAADYRTSPNDEQPVRFQLSAAETAGLFAAASQVDLSQRLEATVKVANMGKKTIRLVKDGKTGEQTFNYTEDLKARALTDWFERISESERLFLDLERSAKYEKIGANQSILLLQTSWERGRLVAPHQFLPLLDRIAKGESYVQMARTRAANLAATFRTIP